MSFRFADLTGSLHATTDLPVIAAPVNNVQYFKNVLLFIISELKVTGFGGVEKVEKMNRRDRKVNYAKFAKS